MRLNPKCYACTYFKQCDKEQEMKCRELNYILFTTEEQSQLCDIMCGRVEDETEVG